MLSAYFRRGVLSGCLCVGLVSSPMARAAQESDSPPKRVSSDRTLQVARDIIKSARFATFATSATSGGPQARIVDPLGPDASFTIYVATNPRSRKVAEVTKDPRVALLYFDPARPGYVTVIGRASEVTGTQKSAHHKQEWQAFFPLEKPDSYSLYRVVPTRIEVVSAPDGLAGDPLTWRPEIALIK